MCECESMCVCVCVLTDVTSWTGLDWFPCSTFFLTHFSSNPNTFFLLLSLPNIPLLFDWKHAAWECVLQTESMKLRLRALAEKRGESRVYSVSRVFSLTDVCLSGLRRRSDWPRRSSSESDCVQHLEVSASLWARQIPVNHPAATRPPLWHHRMSRTHLSRRTCPLNQVNPPDRHWH